MWTFNGTKFNSSGPSFTKSVQHGGSALLKVRVENEISWLEDEIMITINEQIGSLLIDTNATTRDNIWIFQSDLSYIFAATATTGNDVAFNWDIRGVKANGRFTFHTFSQPGIVVVSIKAENPVSAVTVEHQGYVLASINDLKLKINDSSPLTLQPVLISATTQATNATYQFQICLQTQCEKTQTTNKSIIKTFHTAGVYDIRVKVDNIIDQASKDMNVEVFNNIGNLEIIIQESKTLVYAPQNKEVIMKASFTSNGPVSLQWTITRQDKTEVLTSVEQSIRVTFPEYGNYTILLVASNRGTQKSTSKIFQVIQPIQNVNITCDAIKHTYVIVNESYHFSAAYEEGSHLAFIWTLHMPTGKNITIQEESFTHRFAETGEVSIKLNVSNPLGSMTSLRTLTAESLIAGLTIHNNVTMNEYIPVGSPVAYMTNTNAFWPISYLWKLHTGTTILESKTPTISYTFQHAGSFPIYLNATNDISGYDTDILINAEEKIDGLEISPKKTTIEYQTEINFTVTVVRGSGISYLWSFDKTHEINTSKPHISFTFNKVGSYVVNVTASNHLNHVKQTSSVKVVEQVTEVDIVGCCRQAYPANKDIVFLARATPAATNSSYNWTWTGDGQTQTASGQIWNTTFPTYGTFHLGVTVTNTYGTDSHWEYINVEVTIESVHLNVIGDLFGVVNKETIKFEAIVSAGFPVYYKWLINSTVVSTCPISASTCEYQFVDAGTYIVNVVAYNHESFANDTKILKVHEIICTNPVLTLVGHANRIQEKSRSVTIDVTVTACSKHSLNHTWTAYGKRCVYTLPPNEEVPIPISSDVATNTPVLFLPERTLDYGQYCLHFTSQYSGTPGIAPPLIQVNLLIVESSLQAVIKGGSEVMVDVANNIILDGSLSYNPDLETSAPQNLTYLWTCRNTITKVIQNTYFV